VQRGPGRFFDGFSSELILLNLFVTARLPIVAASEESPSTNHGTTGSTFPGEVADELLLARICEGNREATSELFCRYASLVRGVAVRILRDSSEADDLLQEVFLFIHRKSEVFDSSKCSARSWIVQMTYHRAIDRRRYLQSRHFYTCVGLDGTTEVVDPRSQNREVDARLGSLVGNTTIERLLRTLTEDQRNTLSLHFYEGYTFAEIAAKLDQSLGNIRNHYYRGLDKLRQQVFPGTSQGRNWIR
jgi:RNA polymerase sigma-70 factor (ECF subfamily)